ncbi:NeuD protein, partial [Streptococcus ruminantium]|nr:NeuD protein [Streptococcus ruminantium]
IHPFTTIGAGCVVVRNILESGTYVGVPAKKIK